MGQPKLIPPTNVLSLRVARVVKGEANFHGQAKAESYLAGAIEPPLPLTPQRLELIKAYLNDPSRRDEEPAATRIPEGMAPRVSAVPPAAHTPVTSPLFALASGIRTLTAVLVVVALLPNLTLAVFWLRMIDMPWSEPVVLLPTETPMPTVQSAIPPPVLSAPNTLEASAGEKVSLPIALAVPMESRPAVSSS